MFFRRRRHHREKSHKEHRSFFGLHRPFDPKYRAVTSGFLHPVALLIWRLIAGLYALGASIAHLIIQLDIKHVPGREYYVYFTRLTFIGITAYFCFMAFYTAIFILSIRQLKDHESRHAPWYPLQKWGRVLQFLHGYLVATVFTFPVIVTAVYWAILKDENTFANTFNAWSNITFHALNTVFVVLELLISRHRIYLGHLIFCILTLAGYLGIAYIVHATQGFYTYSFLDPNKKPNRIAAYIVGILVAEIVVFVIVWGLAHLRDWIFPRGKGVRVIDPEDEVLA